MDKSVVASKNEKQVQFVTIDGKSYSLDQLSETAKQQLASIRMADLELSRLQAQTALAQTARNVYVQVLKAEIAQMAVAMG